MTFQFPADYRQAFEDVGDLACDMVQVELDRCTPGGWAGTRRPKNADDLIREGQAVVVVHIMPGTVMDDVFRYTPVQFEVTAEDYNTSVKVMQFLEDELTAKYGDGGIVERPGGVRSNVRSFGIDETQQQMVFINPDHRTFEATFQVATKKRTP